MSEKAKTQNTDTSNRLERTDQKEAESVNKQVQSRQMVVQKIRKNRKSSFSIFMVIVALISTVICLIYQTHYTDKTAPVITVPTSEIQCPVSEAGDEQLLAGVKATDDRDGDVTSSLVIEKLGPVINNSRTITYAAVDASNNVGRATRTMVYTNYSAPTFSMSAPLVMRQGDTLELDKLVFANSSVDGDLSSQIKFSFDSSVNVNRTGEYPVHISVMDSAGTTSMLDTELYVYSKEQSKIEITLTEYLVYLDVNAEFDPMLYVEDVSHGYPEQIEVASDVDTGKPGTYLVRYTITDENAAGCTQLVVIVK